MQLKGQLSATDCTAWVLNVGVQLWAAVGELELTHVIPHSPTLFEIPQAPFYCRQVLIWEDQVLPLMDFGARLLGETTRRGQATAEIETLVAIVAYQTQRGVTPKHGAMLLREAPSRVPVGDRQACALPEHPRGWAALAISCFEDERVGPVPVLDVARLYLSMPAPAHIAKQVAALAEPSDQEEEAPPAHDDRLSNGCGD